MRFSDRAVDPGRDEEVEVRAGPVRLGGHLTVPQGATGVVVFAHGSGSSRHSPRNRFVAAVLNEAGIGTLLLDLLTVDEELDRRNVFDLDLLVGRLLRATAWVRAQPELVGLPVGYFGASTGAGAALVAAAEPDADIAAVVSRGGRPDLAASRLADVRAATLLVVGGDDEVVLELNRDAQDRLRCDNRLVVVPGATHLFEEPGTLQRAAEAARDWFTSHMAPAPRSASAGAVLRAPGTGRTTKVAGHLTGGSDEAQLVAALDEVIFQLDTAEGVPVLAHLRPGGAGGLDLVVQLVDRARVEPTGAAPKAVTRSGLRVEAAPGRVWCRFLVDV